MSEIIRSVTPASCARCDHFARKPGAAYGLCLNPASPHHHGRRGCVPIHIHATNLCAFFARPAPASGLDLLRGLRRERTQGSK